MGYGLQQCSSKAFKKDIDIRICQQRWKKHTSRTYDRGLPLTNRNFDNTFKTVDDTGYAAAAALEEPGRVFTQFLRVRRCRALVAPAVTAPTTKATTPLQHWLAAHWPPAPARTQRAGMEEDQRGARAPDTGLGSLLRPLPRPPERGG